MERGSDEYMRALMATGGLTMGLSLGLNTTLEVVTDENDQATPALLVSFVGTGLESVLGSRRYRVTVTEEPRTTGVGSVRLG